jgi:thioredoxin reductase (NADPH)
MKYELIIIGGGPAGLTAGIYAARSRLKTLLIEKGVPGGQISASERVENFPGFPQGISGQELVFRMEEQAKKFGLEIKNLTEAREMQKEKKGFKIFTSEGDFFSQAVIIASGSSPAKLGIPGEKEFTGKGVSYCATCDGAFFKDREVLVVGGGNSAIEEAIFLTKFASKVTVVHRRDELRATKILQERAFENPKIEFIWNSHLVKVMGKEKVEKAVVKNKLTQEEKEVKVDGIFIYVGVKPNAQFLPPEVKVDERGFILTDENMETNVKGIFAAGDVRSNKLKQVVVACGEGALAAHMAEKYLSS